MDKIGKMFAFVDNVLIILAKALLLIMVIIISLNVFMRYVLNSGIRWAEEISIDMDYRFSINDL